MRSYIIYYKYGEKQSFMRIKLEDTDPTTMEYLKEVFFDSCPESDCKIIEIKKEEKIKELN